VSSVQHSSSLLVKPPTFPPRNTNKGRGTLVAVGQNILLLLVSRPTILLLNILFQIFTLFLSVKLERHHVQFFTAVCNNWLKLLESDEANDIVVNAPSGASVPTLIWFKRPAWTLVVVGQNILLLLVSPSLCWSNLLVIVGLPTNNLAAEYPISGFRIIFKHEIGASSCSVLHRCMQ